MAIVGRMVTTVAGDVIARTIGGAAAGPAGAVLGFALPMVARRLGPLGMIGMAVGAWAIHRYAQSQVPEERKPVVTPPPIPMTVPDVY
jgi:hypothetical protein